jgi:hypothetical protein
MTGLLPDETLEPRDTKTGTLEGYFARSMRRDFPALAETVNGSSRLAALGIIEPAAFRAGLAEYMRTGNGIIGYALLQTVQVEFWLRARERVQEPESAENPIALHSGGAPMALQARPRPVATGPLARSPIQRR